MTVSYFTKLNQQRLAYVHIPGDSGNAMPAVMFLGGFKSDMSGTKALFLEALCKETGQEFVRFDYTGHGLSDGAFEEGTIGAWLGDAMDILDSVVKSEQVILVGSSMGGWISLRLLMERKARIHSMIGIAAAPDFTKEVKARMSSDQHDEMAQTGRILEPNEYGDEPYIFTKSLLEDGEVQSILGQPLDIKCPIILLQGKLDDAVPWQKAERIRECFQEGSVDVVYIEDGDHRLSRDSDLLVLKNTLSALQR